MTEKIQPPSGLTREACRCKLLSKFKPNLSIDAAPAEGGLINMATIGLAITEATHGAPLGNLIDQGFRLLTNHPEPWGAFEGLPVGVTWMFTHLTIAAATYIGGREIIKAVNQKANYRQNVEDFLKSEYGPN